MRGFRTINRYFRDAFHGVFRNFSLSLASISCITITLIVVAFSLLLSMNVENFSESIRKDVTVVMFLKSDTTAEDVSKIKKELEGVSNIENSTIEFKSKADSALELKNGNDIFATTVDKWTDDTNPLLDSYMFKVKEIEEIDNTVKEVNNLPFTKDKINNINYGEDIVHQMIVVFNVVRKICIVAVAALVLVTAFLIANTIKLAIYSRRREIEIMRLVGASNTSIKVPFILEGLFIGIIGSIIPILVTIFGYSTLYDFFGGKLFGSALAALIAPMPFVYNISGILVLIGILVGMIGSYQAVRKYLKI
ncbi:MAG: permease-like cell division protein FtsX [Bacilli bacterium]|jgi:cell division transport system permease protein|nr:permease-like cell division protein FtsX [Bacilli bacterium]